jgi:hypothetical protein
VPKSKTEPPPGSQVGSSTHERRPHAQAAAGPHCNIQRWWVRVKPSSCLSTYYAFFSFFFAVQSSTLLQLNLRMGQNLDCTHTKPFHQRPDSPIRSTPLSSSINHTDPTYQSLAPEQNELICTSHRFLTNC